MMVDQRQTPSKELCQESRATRMLRNVQRFMASPNASLTGLVTSGMSVAQLTSWVCLYGLFTLPHSNLLSMHELLQLLDEEMSQEEIQDLEDAQEVFRRFLAWDIQKDLEQDEVQSGTVKEKLAEVLGRS